MFLRKQEPSREGTEPATLLTAALIHYNECIGVTDRMRSSTPRPRERCLRKASQVRDGESGVRMAEYRKGALAPFLFV